MPTGAPSLEEREDASSRSPSFYDILGGQILTFLVGPECKRFTMHAELLAAMSSPLRDVVARSEFMKHTSHFKDIDSRTFARFAQFAYQGVGGLADGVIRKPLISTDSQESSSHSVTESNVPEEWHCLHHKSGVKHWDNNEYPFCSVACRASYPSNVRTIRSGKPRIGFCTSCAICTSHLGRLQKKGSLSQSAERSYSKQQFVKPVPSVNQNSAFAKRTYDAAGMTSHNLDQYLDHHHSLSAVPLTQDSGESLLDQAKLYVLAQRYMVRDLGDICLHILHRNLVSFEIGSQSCRELADLVLYTYDKTSDEGDILSGTADRLRDLVMAYVNDRKEKLTRFEDFRNMLARGGNRTADFFALSMGKLYLAGGGPGSDDPA